MAQTQYLADLIWNIAERLRGDYKRSDLEHTEAAMNGLGERELPERFAGDEYRLLLVADKYQTGFDQPLLHTMYVDKKLSGVRAVQTLSRLNRTYPGKEDTFILDFANEPCEIQEAFQPFYEGTTIEEDIDPNQLYDLRAKMEAFAVTHPDEIEAFARAFFQPRGASSARNHAALNAAIDPAVVRVRVKTGEEQAEYKHLLASFLRLYSFLSQIMPFADADLEKFYAYGRLLTTKLRDEGGVERFHLHEEVALEYYRLQKMSEGSIVLSPDGNTGLRVPSEVGTGEREHEETLLSAIVHDLNKRFGTDFTAADQLFFEQIEEDLVRDRTLSQQAKTNSIDNFRFPFDDVLIGKVIERMEQNQEITDKIMNEDSFRQAFGDLLLKRVYARLQKEN